MSALREALARFPRLDLAGSPTPLEKLERLSTSLGRELYVKRDDTTPFALGGNKVRKLEFLAADALKAGADTLVTAGAIQSNHVRQTAAVAAKLGLRCVALLENPIGTEDRNYLSNGNRLLLDLFGTDIELVPNLDSADELLAHTGERLLSEGRKPYIVPIGGSNALGALGYVRAGLELAEQVRASGQEFSAVVLASGSAGTHAGLAIALADVLPQLDVIGVTVSRTDAAQRPKVEGLVERTLQLLGTTRRRCRPCTCGTSTLARATAKPMPERSMRFACWRARKACCWTPCTPARRWRDCSTASAGIAS